MRCLSIFVLVASGTAVIAQQQKPFDLLDWTPRPAVGKGEPWERMKDPDWDDDRFRKTDTGPTQNATFGYPLGNVSQRVYKGTAVKLGAKGDAAAIFDRSTLSFAAAWTDGYLLHSNRRFGLLNTPTAPPGAKLLLTTASAAGWADAKGQVSLIAKATIPTENMRYRGHYLNGTSTVFAYTVNGTEILDSIERIEASMVRTLNIAAHDKPLTLRVDDARVAKFEANAKAETVFTVYGPPVKVEALRDLTALTKAGPAHWGKPILTKLVRGDEKGPFAVDTLTIPYDNPSKALFFCTGLDFLPDGRIAVCTCHGDVWLAKVDEKAGEVSWQRFATGLYHPLGLKVVDGKVVVLERGQLTRLHDSNGDGEADFYECLSNDWHTGAGEHSYDTCLETDPDGNFYFFKTGDTDLPSGGCLLKVSADGKKVETFATGFRHPIGMGMSPSGILTGADQEGNWMPATRIDQYKKGGFYGDMRAAHRTPLPTIYDPPLCWLPREVDNSAGGQVWVPKDTFGALAGLPIHFSYGRCRPFVLLRQEFDDGTAQGGVAGLPVQFLAGVCRGRFQDKMLYVCGLNGWQTGAKADGCLQRMRMTEAPLDTVVKHEITATGVKLTFSRSIDKAIAENPANYKAAWWNYRWVGEYGSKRWKVSNPNIEGQDDLVFESAKLLDEKTVFLKLPGGMKPVMQLQVGYNLTAKDAAAKVMGSVFLTIHKLAK